MVMKFTPVKEIFEKPPDQPGLIEHECVGCEDLVLAEPDEPEPLCAKCISALMEDF